MDHNKAKDFQNEWDSLPNTENIEQYISSNLLELKVQRLDAYTQALGSNISDYVLDRYDDLLGTEEPEIARVAWFRKGIDNYFICYNSSGHITFYEEIFPIKLLVEIANEIISINYNQIH